MVEGGGKDGKSEIVSTNGVVSASGVQPETISTDEAEIFKIVASEDSKELTYFIEAGNDINIYSNDGFSTPLIRAIGLENSEIRRKMVKTFVKWRVDVNMRLRQSGFTAMHKAVERRDREVIKMLVNGGGNFHMRGFNGCPVIMWSVNDKELLNWLMESKHVDPNTRAEQMNGTVLFYYEERGEDHADAFEMCLDKGAHLYHRDYWSNKTVYDLAKEHKKTKIISKIEKHIFKMVEMGDFDRIWLEIHRSFDKWDITNQDGKTPCEVALERNNEELGQLLDPTNISKFHETIEECVLKSEQGDLDAVKNCCEEDFLDPKCLSKDSRNPIHAAAANDHKTIVDYLLGTGVEVNMPDGKYCLTPLHYAAGNGHVKTAEYLINRGADIIAEDTNGMTPLEYANYMVQYEGKEFDLLAIAELFFNHGYDPNRPTSTGLTFLHEVSTYSKALVDLAVQRGAKVDCKSVALDQTIMEMLDNDLKDCKEPERRKILQYMRDYVETKANSSVDETSVTRSTSETFSELERLVDKNDRKNSEVPTDVPQEKKKSKSCTIL